MVKAVHRSKPVSYCLWGMVWGYFKQGLWCLGENISVWTKMLWIVTYYRKINKHSSRTRLVCSTFTAKQNLFNNNRSNIFWASWRNLANESAEHFIQPKQDVQIVLQSHSSTPLPSTNLQTFHQNFYILMQNLLKFSLSVWLCNDLYETFSLQTKRKTLENTDIPSRSSSKPQR